MGKTTTALSTSSLLRRTFSLFSEDYVLALPAIIGSFLLMLIAGHLLKTPTIDLGKKLTPEIVVYLAISWIIMLLAQAVTIYLANSQLRQKNANIAQAFVSALRKFIPLSSLLITLIVLFGSTTLLLMQLPKNIIPLFLIPVTLLMLVCLQIFPVIILLESGNYLGRLVLMIKSQFSELIRLFVGIAIILLTTFFLSAFFESSPVAGKQIALPFIQGLSNALATMITVIFYHALPSKVDTNV